MERLINESVNGRPGRFGIWYLKLHLRGCTPCRKFLSSLEDLTQKLRATRAAEPDPEVVARLREHALSILRSD